MTEPPLLSLTLWIVEGVATLAFALSGVLQAARKRLDVVGVCVVAGLAAFGGGTLRDVLLDRRPFVWVDQPLWLWGLIVLGFGSMALLRTRHVEPTERAMLWPDALGLGLFAAAGTWLAWQQGLPAIVSVLMGVITATFGGVLRDIVCNEIPTAFRDHRPYAVCAFAGGWLLLGLDRLGLPGEWAVGLAALATTALRGLALWRDWRLPPWQAEAS